MWKPITRWSKHLVSSAETLTRLWQPVCCNWQRILQSDDFCTLCYWMKVRSRLLQISPFSLVDMFSHLLTFHEKGRVNINIRSDCYKGKKMMSPLKLDLEYCLDFG